MKSEASRVRPVERTDLLGDGQPYESEAWTGADHIQTDLDARGYCVLPKILPAETCLQLIEGYGVESAFRSTVAMARHGFGSGEYRYYAAPLPEPVATLRDRLYSLLVPTADAWSERLGEKEGLGEREKYPRRLRDYLDICAHHGQTKPTPLILSYKAGDYNCLHQDIYGDLFFPLQVAILLSCPEKDFSGGEFVVTEQRVRQQAKPQVIRLSRGDGVIFPVRHRPFKGVRGHYRVQVRHGISPLASGQRFALGIIFHNAA